MGTEERAAVFLSGAHADVGAFIDLRSFFRSSGRRTFVGLFIILFSLLLEHLLARRRSMKWVNVAFFRLNALVSLVFVTATIISVAFPWFRAPVGVSIPYWM